MGGGWQGCGDRHAARLLLQKEALAGRRAVLGEAHPSTLTSINNLSLLLHAQGRLDEARPLLEEARRWATRTRTR